MSKMTRVFRIREGIFSSKAKPQVDPQQNVQKILQNPGLGLVRNFAKEPEVQQFLSTLDPNDPDVVGKASNWFKGWIGNRSAKNKEDEFDANMRRSSKEAWQDREAKHKQTMDQIRNAPEKKFEPKGRLRGGEWVEGDETGESDRFHGYQR